MAKQKESETAQQLRKKVMYSCRIMGDRGVTRGSFGHVSARIAGTDKILIKSKGVNEEALEFTREKDIITIDIRGNVLQASTGLDAPHETAMHLAVYRARPEVMSVIHAHPDWVVALTASDKPLLPIYAAYNPPGLKLLLDGIPLYRRSVTIIDDVLGQDFIKVMGDKNACLLIGHGITTAGRSVEEVTLTTLNLFELARLNYLAYAIGDPKPIPAIDIEEFARRWKTHPGRSQVSSKTEHPDWRYFKKLLGKK
jgi:ribulose-5-phosphate 4-epimerase/fuculose-1-phosphate aldolase